jgi:hypothetical protein
MQTQNSELPPKPPAALQALMSGFNVITGNMLVILFPVALDLFLWFGPRLKVHDLFISLFDELIKLQANTPTPFPTATHAEIEKFLDSFNLFSNLRTYPLGLFSLMINNQAGNSPLGPRLDWEIPNWLVLISAFILLTCFGLLFGSLYFYFVSRAALRPQPGPGLIRAVFHSLIIWSALTIGTYFIVIPILGLGLALTANNQLVMLLLFLLLAWPATWVGLMVFFSTHGVFVLSKNAFTTLTHNFRILRYGMPPMGWFALIAIVISQGMDLIWLNPPADSWMTLVGILGHAFISTGLLAASFIFYRDMNTWVDEALAWVKTHQITSARA